MENDKTISYCEICGSMKPFKVPTNDRSEGQICPTCMEKAQGVIYRVRIEEGDQHPRYFPTLEEVGLYFDEGLYYGWYEMNDAERERYGNVGDVDDIDITDLGTLRQTVQKRMDHLTEWWTRNKALRIERDNAMNEWTHVMDGSWSKPIDWVKDMPEPFTAIIDTVEIAPFAGGTIADDVCRACGTKYHIPGTGGENDDYTRFQICPTCRVQERLFAIVLGDDPEDTLYCAGSGHLSKELARLTGELPCGFNFSVREVTLNELIDLGVANAEVQ